MNANRWAWNTLIEKIGDRLFSVNQSELQAEIRPLIQKSNMKTNLDVSNVPDDCFDSAYRDIFKAKKTIKTHLRDGLIKHLPKQLNWRCLKTHDGVVHIRSRDIKYLKRRREIRVYPKYLNLQKNRGLRIKTDLSKYKIDNSCKLIRENDKFYLHVCHYQPKWESQTDSVLAIDPGVRTFITGYDPNGNLIEMGTNPQHIEDKIYAISRMQKRLKQSPKRKREKLRKRIRNTYKKIHNSVNDMHHKISKWLSMSYKKILLPSFGTQKMAMKKTITKKSIRQMLNWGHYRFKQLLKHKMSLSGGEVIDCTEEYTTKTCTKCGRLNHHVGASKRFKCRHNDCKFMADRDVNAARNILVKNVHKLFPIEMSL